MIPRWLRRKIINEFIDAMIDHGLAGQGGFTTALRCVAEAHIENPHVRRPPPDWTRPLPIEGPLSEW
jgi:hypothetical protein